MWNLLELASTWSSSLNDYRLLKRKSSWNLSLTSNTAGTPVWKDYYLETIYRLVLLEVKRMLINTITVLDSHNVDLGYRFILVAHISRASFLSQLIEYGKAVILSREGLAYVVC